MGAYAIAWTLASVPVDRMATMINRVALPVLSAVQQNQPALRRYIRLITEGVAFFTFPAAIGLALVADEFIPVVLGAHWAPAVAPLQLLAVYTGFRSIATLYGQVLIASGHERANLHFNLIAVVTLPAMFYLATRWGISGVAWAWIAGYPLIAIGFFLRRVLVIAAMPAREYVGALAPALTGTVVMSSVVLGLRAATADALSPTAALVLHSLAGMTAYAAYVYLVQWERVMAVIRTLRGHSREPTGP